MRIALTVALTLVYQNCRKIFYQAPIVKILFVHSVPDLFGLTQSDINVNQWKKVTKFIRKLWCLVLVNWKQPLFEPASYLSICIRGKWGKLILYIYFMIVSWNFNAEDSRYFAKPSISDVCQGHGHPSKLDAALPILLVFCQILAIHLHKLPSSESDNQFYISSINHTMYGFSFYLKNEYALILLWKT